MAKYKNNLPVLVSIFKALGDPSRLRVFNVLREGELCVCQIIELLQLAPSTVSKHMSILKQAGLVESRKEGRWIYYRLSSSSNSLPYVDVVKDLEKQLQVDKQANEDLKIVGKILKYDPEDLCKKQ